MRCLSWRLAPACVKVMLLGLQWQDIDFEKKTVTVARNLTTVNSKFVLKSPKTRSSRRTIKAHPTSVVECASEKHRLAMLAEGNIAVRNVLYPFWKLHRQVKLDPPGLSPDPGRC